MGTRHKIYRAAFLAVIFLAGGSPTVSAQELLGGGLSVAPNRIIFEGRDRFHQVTILNRGQAASNYKITLITTEMDEEGHIKQVKNEDGKIRDAGRIIRYAPRQVKLGPGQGQVIRLSVRKPKDLEEGEYRSNMLIAAVPDEKPDAVKRSQTENTTALSIQIKAYFAISIPVMVRHGNLHATSRAEGLELAAPDPKKPESVMAITTVYREGNRTTYGDAVLKYFAPGGGAPLVVGEIINVGTYPPLAKRKVQIPVKAPDGVTLSKGGKLELTYSDKPRQGNKPIPPSVISMEIK